MKTSDYALIILGMIFLFSISASAALIYYDGNDSNSSFVNSTNKATGMTHFYRDSENLMMTSGGRRGVDGSGDPNGNEYFDLNPSPGDAWDQAGFYDSVSGTIGGGAVEGVLYLSFLVKAYHTASTGLENKTGDLPHGCEFGVELLRDDDTLLGIGNQWGAHAYSTYGSVTGKKDLRDTDLKVAGVNTAVRLMVTRIAFHANAADDISVWLDPDPRDGNIQSNKVLRYIGTADGDMSFNRIAYTSGNIPIINAIDFDELRFGTSWEDVTPVQKSSNKTIWYDGQGADSLFANTIYNSDGLHYAMANEEYLKVSGGKRIAPGTSTTTNDVGTDTFAFDTGANSIWKNFNLFDVESGLIGGGDINGVVYFGALVRAQNNVNSTTEHTAAFVQLTRPGLDFRGALSLGSGPGAWGYGISGVFQDNGTMTQEGTNTYVSYNTSVHMIVAKIIFRGNGNDSMIAWLDPNPDDGDLQASTICRSKTYLGDASFNQICYRSGALGALSAWEFDEVRLATSWSGVMPYHYGTVIMLR